MKSVTTIFLFGSLSKNKGGNENRLMELELQTPTSITEVLNRLGIEAQDVSLAMVNHRSVPRDWIVHPGDRLSLFPKEYPIFADWLDHRI